MCMRIKVTRFLLIYVAKSTIMPAGLEPVKTDSSNQSRVIIHTSKEILEINGFAELTLR